MGWLREFSFDPKTLTGANSITAHIVELANMLRSGAVAFGYRAQVLAFFHGVVDILVDLFGRSFSLLSLGRIGRWGFNLG